jgi:hypothetical protein
MIGIATGRWAIWGTASDDGFAGVTLSTWAAAFGLSPCAAKRVTARESASAASDGGSTTQTPWIAAILCLMFPRFGGNVLMT